MTERYRVPKFRVRVDLHTVEGTTEQVALFLSERAQEHAGPEGPLDVLNADDEFIVVEFESGEVGLVRRGSVAMVTVSGETSPQDALSCSDPVLADLFVEAKLKLVLGNGDEIEGVAHYERPEQNRRVQDFMNGPEPFVPLTHDGRISFVNKSCIARVLLP